jgi:hypothetical protein
MQRFMIARRAGNPGSAARRSRRARYGTLHEPDEHTFEPETIGDLRPKIYLTVTFLCYFCAGIHIAARQHGRLMLVSKRGREEMVAALTEGCRQGNP